MANVWAPKSVPFASYTVYTNHGKRKGRDMYESDKVNELYASGEFDVDKKSGTFDVMW